MKKQKLKFLIPALAIVFAMTASAFTVKDNKLLDENNAIAGEYYLNASNPCEPISVSGCSTSGNKVCQYNSETVFQAGSNCIVQLKRP